MKPLDTSTGGAPTQAADSLRALGGGIASQPITIGVLPSQRIRSYPTHTVGGTAWPFDLGAALTRMWSGEDAHFAAYRSPSNARRLSSAALLPEHIAEIGAFVQMALLVVDVDAPDSVVGPSAMETWRRGERVKLDRLLQVHRGYQYDTRNGYRILGRLDPAPDLLRPEDAAIWKRWYLSALAMLRREYGIVGDPACSDWTRIYRLPHATRDQGGKPEQRPTIGDPRNIGAWDTSLINDDDRAAVEAASGPARPVFTPSAPTGTGFVLETLLRSRGLLGATLPTGKTIVLCPWRDLHDPKKNTDGTDATVLWPPSGGNLGKFYCAHSHCIDRRAADVLALFTADEIDEANGRPTRAEREARRRPPWPTDRDVPARYR